MAEWFEYVRPDFVQANTSYIAGGKKLIAAKAALKGRKDTFTELVEGLGLDQDKAERLMTIARHPLLSDSAHARIFPLSWMTQYTLAKIAPEALGQFIADGKIHPKLKRKEAERLVELARGRNSPDQGGNSADGSRGNGHDQEAKNYANAGAGDDDDRDDDHGGDDRDDNHGGDNCDQSRDDKDCDQQAQDIPNNLPVPRNDIGPDSRSELDRKLARLEELEREKRQWEIQRQGHESEVEELRVKLRQALAHRITELQPRKGGEPALLKASEILRQALVHIRTATRLANTPACSIAENQVMTALRALAAVLTDINIDRITIIDRHVKEIRCAKKSRRRARAA
jgi:hypothetical protein